VLRALYLFREDCAEAQNRPPFKVLSNKALLALSEQRPEEPAGLRQVKGVPSWLVRKYGRKLLTAIRDGEEQPLAWDERPRFMNGNNRASNGRHNGRPSAACQARFEALRIWRNATAEERGVEPDLVLTNQALWEIAHAKPSNRDELAHDGLLARWQVDEFGKDLLRVIGNKP
jgi:ribonuclease D